MSTSTSKSMSTSLQMQREHMTLGHRQRGLRAHVWRGGAGTPVVLLHGAWSGARAHWSPVWDLLCRRYTVIAPELPGVMSGSGERKLNFAELADWLDEVLACADCGPAIVVGNALGATVAWQLAASYPASCRALVMVDGLPLPALPDWRRWALLNTPLRRRALARLRSDAHGKAALANGFFDPARAPAEVRAELETPDDDRLTLLLDLALHSGPVTTPPRQPTLIVWGENDRLPATALPAGRSLHDSLPGSRFEVIAGAGHMPQVEQPQRFADIVSSFAADVAGRAPR